MRQALPHPFERFNTVMKFYSPVWVFLGIASVYAVFWVLGNTRGKLKAVWVALLLVLVLASIIQPIGQTIGWASSKRDYSWINRGTLDGVAYVKTIAPGDYEAIQWINGHIKGQLIADSGKARMRTKALEKLKRLASDPRGQVFLVILTLAVSLLIRLLLFRYHGYDEGAFKFWYNTAAEKGLYGFYDSTYSDHPPFNIYIFWLFGKLAHAIGPGSLDFFIKLPQNLFDLATAYLIFRLLRPRYSFLFALGAMAVYALNPATIFDLAVWGQTDSIHTFFMVASLFALMRSRYELSGGLFSLAILTKPQSVVLLPVLAYLMLRNGGWKRAISSGAVFFVLLFLLIIPFHWDNPITFLVDRYSKGYSMFQYNSLNAYNFWALLGFWKPDTVPHGA